jgi:uncharacterized protein
VIEQELPVFELFTRLRQADVPLGVDEYTLLQRALQAGFGIGDEEALARVCKTLWIKSDDQMRLFDHHFKQVMTRTEDSRNVESSGPSSSRLEQLSSDLSASIPAPTDVTPTSSSEATLNIESQAAQAVLHAASEDELPYNRFIRSDEYFPVTRRQMKQSWRYLRRPIREGPRSELDVDATIREIARAGLWLTPVLIPPRKNRAELLLLIDQGGSMVPFHALSRRLADTALRGGRLVRVSIYYFYNCPTDYLYRKPTHRDAVPIQAILDHAHDERAGVLIFSDAGAARGGLNPERFEMTKLFLAQLNQQFRYAAWLNPTPHDRWAGTTAGKIGQLVPMFDVSRRGLDAAISSLRGRNTSFMQTRRHIQDG